MYDGCTTRPHFGKEGEKAQFCNKHKQEDMVDVNHPRCMYDGCTRQPHFGKEGEKAQFCNKHKQEDMVNVISPRCKTPLCRTTITKKYEGYCRYCFMHMFPDKPVARNYKTKETAVTHHVKSKFNGLTWVSDKMVSGGCSRRRPDLLLHLGDQVIVVEVDENQHIEYDCSCENKRMMELSQDVGHCPIVFIRFNPDDYKSATNITSCWGVDKMGICKVKKTKQKEWVERLLELEQTIQYWIESRTSKTIEVVHLFYDQ